MGTLAYYLGGPAFQNRDLSGVPANKFRLFVRRHLNEKGSSNPNQLALDFYLGNHLVGELKKVYSPHEPLKSEHLGFVKSYSELVHSESVRMFHYLLLICTRESRHVKAYSLNWEEVEDQFGPEITTFIQAIRGTSSTAAYKRFLSGAPKVDLGKYTEWLSWVFYNGSYSGGYGGDAWGAVADCLHAYVTGQYTAEVMLDTSFTLCHNNGPIFNKGMQFSGYSSGFVTMLDVQRSGQIPEFIREGCPGTHATGDVNILQEFTDVTGVSFGDQVDWFKVEALGGVLNHTHKQNKQLAEGFTSPYLTEAQEAKQKAHADQIKATKKAQAKLIADQKKFARENYEYFPGQYVKKVKLERSA